LSRSHSRSGDWRPCRAWRPGGGYLPSRQSGSVFRSYCVSVLHLDLHITSIYAIITISKKNAKFYMKFYDSCCFRYFSRIGIFRTENSVRYRCGRGFCRFGMRSIGKIPLKHMDSQKNVASLGLTNHAIWIKIQKEVNKLNKNSKYINSGQRYI